MARRRSQFWTLAGLVVACCGLVWVIYQQLAAAPGPSLPGDPRGVQVASVPELPPEADFSMPPIDTFDAILLRPIFSPTRSPPSEAGPAEEVVGGDLSFALKGIIIGSNERVALFRPNDGTKIVRVSQGSRLAGWTVVAIEPNQVTLERGEARKVMEPSFDSPAPKRQRSNRQRQAEQQLRELLSKQQGEAEQQLQELLEQQ
ncbi:MAG: hypothetical protein V3S45_01505 [Kiloniellales bacterium]